MMGPSPFSQAQDQLRSVIRQRLEQNLFSWSPILGVWAGLLTIRTLVEAWTGPRADLGAVAFGLGLGFQYLWGLTTPKGRRQGSLQGLWSLLMVFAWFLGSLTTQLHWLSPQAGATLELLLLGGGLWQTGILKERRSLIFSGLGLVVSSVALATWAVLIDWRPVIYLLGLGIPTVLTVPRKPSSPT